MWEECRQRAHAKFDALVQDASGRCRSPLCPHVQHDHGSNLQTSFTRDVDLDLSWPCKEKALREELGSRNASVGSLFPALQSSVPLPPLETRTPPPRKWSLQCLSSFSPQYLLSPCFVHGALC